MRFNSKPLDRIGTASILLYCGWVYSTHLNFRSTQTLQLLQTPYLVPQARLATRNQATRNHLKNKEAIDSVPDYREFNFESESKGAPNCSALQDDDIDFTFVTQLSLDRIWIMQEHCSRWGLHPISVALGGNITHSRAFDLIHGLGCDMQHISFQVTNDFSGASEFPINRLRNMALSAVKTSHAIIVDADFLISEHLYEHLMLHRPSLHDPKHALVIPAFQLVRQCAEAIGSGWRDMHLRLLPKSKDRLIELLLEVDRPAGPHIEQFDSAGNFHGHLRPLRRAGPLIRQFDSSGNIHGHSSTRLGNWLKQPIAQLLPIDCIKSPAYEPYLVVRYCNALPPFQNAFEGFGWNKVTWVHHLIRTGYRFSQISGGYMVHFPHGHSESKILYHHVKPGLKNKTNVHQIASSFRIWLFHNIKDETAMPHCKLPEEEKKCLRKQGENHKFYDCCIENWHPEHESLCKRHYTETNHP